VYQDVDRKYQRQGHCIWLLDDEIVAGEPVHRWAERILLEWRLSGGYGYDRIAKELTEAGVPTSNGAHGWSSSTICYMLKWDKLLSYAGYGIWNKDDCTGHQEKRRPSSEWVVVEHAHPAIITLEQAEAIHQMVAGRKQIVGVTRGREESRWLLSRGLMVCGACGANYTGTTYKKIDYYICGAHQYRSGAGCPVRWTFHREEVEEMVFQAICRRLPKGAARLQRIVDMVNRRIDDEIAARKDTEKDRLARIAELTEEIEAMNKMLAKGYEPDGGKDHYNARVQDRRRLQEFGKYPMPQKISAATLSEVAESAWKARESGTNSEKRKVIEQWVESLIVDPAKQEITLHLKDGYEEVGSLGGECTGGANASRTPRRQPFTISHSHRGRMRLYPRC
jgi:hypothetical protein